MKANIDKHKLEIAQKAEAKLPNLIIHYQTGDLQTLGDLCNSISTLAEFYEDRPSSDLAKRVPRLMTYLADKFRNCLYLILNNSSNYYGYTANTIAKFIRGESVHGASEIKDNKRKTLYEFVFEKNTKIECEFHISWNWIAGPNIRSREGNIDSGGPFLHVVQLNEKRLEVSLIESVILGIAYEFWQANTYGEPRESTKCFVKFNPNLYSSIWGKELSDKLYEQLIKYYGLKISETDD